MEFKLNLAIEFEAGSEQNARHRREMIYSAIRGCPGVSSIDDLGLTTKMPDFEEVEEPPKHQSMDCVYWYERLNKWGCTLDVTGLKNCGGDYNLCPYKDKKEVRE